MRFARDLHDLLGHSLSLIALKSELAGRLAERRPGAGPRGDGRRRGGGAAGARRGPRRGQRLPPGQPAPRRWPRRAPRCPAAGIALRGCPTPGAALPGTVDAVLGWVVREATTNVLRHSGAGRVTVEPDRGRRRRSCWPSPTTGRAARRPRGAGAGLAGLGRAGRRRSAGELAAGPAGGGGFRLPPPCRCCPPVRRGRAAAGDPGAASPRTRPWCAARCGRCWSWRTTSRSWPRSAAATPVRGRRAASTGPTSRCWTSRCPGGTGIEAARELRGGAARLPGGRPDHLRPAGLPAPGDGGRRGRLPGQGRAGGRAGPRRSGR